MDAILMQRGFSPCKWWPYGNKHEFLGIKPTTSFAKCTMNIAFFFLGPMMQTCLSDKILCSNQVCIQKTKKRPNKSTTQGCQHSSVKTLKVFFACGYYWQQQCRCHGDYITSIFFFEKRWSKNCTYVRYCTLIVQKWLC